MTTDMKGPFQRRRLHPSAAILVGGRVAVNSFRQAHCNMYSDSNRWIFADERSTELHIRQPRPSRYAKVERYRARRSSR
jgi:hypothetical protein